MGKYRTVILICIAIIVPAYVCTNHKSNVYIKKIPTLNIITPVYKEYSLGRIFDFVITGDNHVFFSGVDLDWPWTNFSCMFNDSVSTLGKVSNFEYQNTVECELPNAFADKTFTLTVFEDSKSKVTILSDVTITPYPRSYHNLSIYTMIKDIGAMLPEWIEYHLMLGVEHFYLYDNGSTDNTRKILQNI